jgi:hypothetical protein
VHFIRENAAVVLGISPSRHALVEKLDALTLRASTDSDTGTRSSNCRRQGCT